MILAIDVGGTKTLLAVFTNDGKIVYKNKIKTNPSYTKFKAQLKKEITSLLKEYKLKACACAMPGHIDRNHGIVKHYGNLKWQNIPIKEDLERFLGKIPIFIENDANLAGLSEALLVHERYKKVLYLTISTGIGGGVTIDGKIPPILADVEPGQMVMEHEGKIQKWESFASGRALVERFGKIAAEQNDPEVWTIFSRDLAKGLEHLLAVIQPEVVIFGGGVGAHYDKFAKPLANQLKKLENDMVRIPPLMKAKRPEEAVIYGCYDFVQQNI